MYQEFGLLLRGKWWQAASGESMEVISPVTEASIGSIPMAADVDIDLALDLVVKGQAIWSAYSAWERAKILHKTANLLRDGLDKSSQIMSQETGKPLAESRAEIKASAEQFEWYGEEAKRIYGQSIPGRSKEERMYVLYQPVGPCLALSAWNFPMLLPSRKIAAALAAGNAVIARPSSEAPGSCFVIGQALLDAGLPKETITILTGPAEPMIEKLILAPQIRKVSLTGSVPVGRRVMSLAAKGLKKVSMELGGHAPVIIHSDYDPILAAGKLAPTKFRNCGQVCISPSRFYVHESIKLEFEKEFASIAESLVIGDGLSPFTEVGPLIREGALVKALALIKDAINQGGRLLTGGNRPSRPAKGYFLQPTVITDVPDRARIMIEEPFAPIAPISSFQNEKQVMEKANATGFGLAAYVFTHESARAEAAVEALEAGMIGINETLLATAEAPFGGVKDSGFGREGGSLGIVDYLVPKYVRHRLVKRS